MAKTIKLELSDMEHEALMLMLKKAGLTTDDILLFNIKSWVHDHTKLLNQKELDKFEPIFKLKTSKPTKNAAKQK